VDKKVVDEKKRKEFDKKKKDDWAIGKPQA
jgi:hypothetical protein